MTVIGIVKVTLYVHDLSSANTHTKYLRALLYLASCMCSYWWLILMCYIDVILIRNCVPIKATRLLKIKLLQEVPIELGCQESIRGSRGI